MKKIFTLFAALLALATTAGAQEVDQTFQFTDLQGNVVADGTVITVQGINEEGQMVVPLKVKKVKEGKVAVGMYENIDEKPVEYDENGKVSDWQTCAFGNCMYLSESGYSSKSIVDDSDEGYHVDIQTEWMPAKGKYAEWTATLQIQLFNINSRTAFGRTIESAGDEIVGYGPKVTVRLVYSAQSSSVGSLKADSTPVEYYNLCGERIPGPKKGLNIVRLANGKTVKKLFN